MTTEADFLTSLKIRVKDTADRFTDDEKKDIIQEAVKQYSRDKPRLRDALFAGDGSTQTYAVPTGWVDGFSIVRQMEYPTGEVPMNFLRVQENVTVIQQDEVPKVVFTAFAPASGENVRLYYITPHTVDDSSSTIPANDEDAIVNLSASLFCRALAAFYAEELESTLSDDAVVHPGQADKFDQLADTFLKQYLEHITDGEVETAVLAHFDYDAMFSWGRHFLTHSRRRR